MRQRPGAVEADLLRYYRADLRDLWRGTLSLRRLCVLIEHLPDESASKAWLAGSKPGWSATTFAVADLFHAMTGDPHPARPQPSKTSQTAEVKHLASQLGSLREMERQRQAALAAE